jgi:DNA-binding MarR family transcriptional regulator
MFSKKSYLKLIYFFLSLMLILHSFQGFQGWNQERSENKVYTIPYSELDTFFIDLIHKMNHGTSTSTVISLEIVFNHISNTDYFSLSLLTWQSLAKDHIPHVTMPFLVNGEIFGLGGTTYSIILLIGTIDYQKLKYQETKRQLSRNKNRTLIKVTITENPGINLREIQRSTNLAMGVIQYHLRSLESEGCEIESLRFGRSKHFFLTSAGFSIEQKLWFSLSRNQNIKSILELVAVSGGHYSQKDLSHVTGYSKSLISYYIKILRFNGVIEVEDRQLRISDDFSRLNHFLHEKNNDSEFGRL